MITDRIDQYIREVILDKNKVGRPNRYPFNLPAIRALDRIELHPNVTFFVGENGSGKSTLLEAISAAYGFNPEGGSKHTRFATRDSHSVLHEHMKIIKGISMPRDGYFLRAESFYNVATDVDSLGPEILEAYGGTSLHEQSHGESFMSLVINRFKGKGLYILDEPEAALSPTRQLALIRRIHQLVDQDSQWIIATHSPILLAYPHAKIYDLDQEYAQVAYEQTDHYLITKEFLMHPQRMLEMLMKE